jgi:hypothetical protein
MVRAAPNCSVAAPRLKLEHGAPFTVMALTERSRVSRTTFGVGERDQIMTKKRRASYE